MTDFESLEALEATATGRAVPEPSYLVTSSPEERMSDYRAACRRSADSILDEQLLKQLCSGYREIAKFPAFDYYGQDCPAEVEKLREELVQLKLYCAYPPFKPGRPASWRTSLELRGPISRLHDGWADHGRRLAYELAHSFVVKMTTTDPGGGMVDASILASNQQFATARPLMERSSTNTWAQILHLVPYKDTLHATVWGGVGRGMTYEQAALVNKRRILSVVYERDRVPPSDVEALNSVAAVWVPSTRCRQVLVDNGVDESKVAVVPIPLRAEDKAGMAPSKETKTTFYHIGKWEPRKDQPRMLEAFMLAFKSTDNVQMLIKTMTLREAAVPILEGFHVSPKETVAALLGRPDIAANGWTKESVLRAVHVWDTPFSEEQIRALHGRGHVYVSLAHSEGFCMPAYQAKALGRRMIYVPSGGVEDFATQFDFEVPVVDMVRTHPFYGWGKKAKWWDYDMAAAVTAFRKAHEVVSAGGCSEMVAHQTRAKALALFDRCRVVQSIIDALGNDGPMWPTGFLASEHSPPISFAREVGGEVVGLECDMRRWEPASEEEVAYLKSIAQFPEKVG